MSQSNSVPGATAEGICLQVVTLECKDGEYAKRCFNALATYGRPDALAFN